MKRYIKKNLLLIAVLSVSSLVALAMLVYAIILTLDWSGNLARTESARSQVQKLVRSKPAPGRENERRIRQDIELYQKASQGLLSRFKSPLQDAVDIFLAELEPPLLDKLTDEEKEWILEKEEDSSDAAAETAENKEDAEAGEAEKTEKKPAPVKVRKLSQDDFRRLYSARYEKFKENKKNTEFFSFQNQFLNSFRAIFPAKSWNNAMSKFVAAARPLTVEPIENNNSFSVLIANMGFPRAIPEQIIPYITAMAETIEARATAGKLNLGASGILDNFLYPWREKNSSARLQVVDYQAILFHWDVLGDIVSRLCKSKISTLNNVIVRNSAEEATNNTPGMGNATAYSFERTVEDEGDYRIYHYTIDVVGSMPAIRAAATAFDNAYKENRTYIVRSVTLYAMENGAAILLGQEDLGSTSSPTQENAPTPGRRRRRRRMDPVEMEAAAPRNSSEEEDAEEERKRREEMEARLPIEQRSGYGEIKIGSGKEYRAVFDVDYIVLKQKQ